MPDKYLTGNGLPCDACGGTGRVPRDLAEIIADELREARR
jgi:hypothetical protein